MLDEMRVNDEQLNASDIRQLENADEIAHFFAKLRYDVNERTNIPDYGVLGMGSEDMRRHIDKIELIGKDPEDGDISIYLFEVRSVTAKLRNDIARRFRERPENALLVLTKDYEELEFVLLERVLSKSQSRRTALKQAIRPVPLTVDRLHPDSKLTPEWEEDVRPVGREIYKHLITSRKNYSRQPEDMIRRGLYEPVFKLLGFEVVKQKSGASAAATEDYLLYTPGNKSKPIAAALTYVWNRNLDDVDESREREESEGGTYAV